VTAILKLEDHLVGLQIDDEVDVMTFLAVEKHIASGLRERAWSSAETINANDVRAIATRRQDIGLRQMLLERPRFLGRLFMRFMTH